MPREVYRVFNIDLLHRAAINPLPRQVVDNAQLPPIIEANSDPEQAIEAIIGARQHKRSRGRYRQALVKQVGYAKPTQELAEVIADTIVLNKFKAKYREITDYNGLIAEALQER